MNLERFRALFAEGESQAFPEAPAEPRGELAAVALGNPIANPVASPEAVLEAREERAAILEFEAGLTREAAEVEAARLHPDPSNEFLPL
jgi:hypothetical protein